MYVLEPCETARQTNGNAVRSNCSQDREAGKAKDDTFLPKSSDSLSTPRSVTLFSAILRRCFLLRLAPARATTSGIVRGSARATQ